MDDSCAWLVCWSVVSAWGRGCRRRRRQVGNERPVAGAGGPPICVRRSSTTINGDGKVDGRRLRPWGGRCYESGGSCRLEAPWAGLPGRGWT